MYGSGANSLALRGTSDIDICVKLPDHSEELLHNNNLMYEVLIEGLHLYQCDDFKIQKSSVFNAVFGSNVDIALESADGIVIKVGICLERPETLRHRDLFRTYIALD